MKALVTTYRQCKAYKPNYHARYTREDKDEFNHYYLLLLWYTYTYEVLDESAIRDVEWDDMAKYVCNNYNRVTIKGKKSSISPSTGYWIHNQ